jgi:beta-glucosidase-like glycosyl hydrolase
MTKPLLTIIFIFLLIPSCGVKRFDKETDLIISRMDTDHKIAQMLISAVNGSTMNKKAETMIKEFRPGGVILFGYNLAGKNETKLFIQQMQQLSMEKGGLPMFISVDQEGGRVIRVTEGVTGFPGAMASGVAADERLIRDSAAILGLQLRDMGFNMNFAPVLDVNNNPANPVINTRSAGSEPAVVSMFGTAYIRGLQSGGCITVGKHFPGHGDTDKDSHHTLPVIKHGIDRLRKVELVPFDRAIRTGMDCVMSAHISYPEILRNGTPATHSSYFMKELLRDELGFKGLAVTDCLEMSAVSAGTDIGESAVRSIEAGIDLILFTSYEKSVPAVMKAVRSALDTGRLTEKRIDESVRRIIEIKLRYGIMGYSEGTVTAGVTPASIDRKILERADEVNAEISRKALYLENESAEYFNGFTRRLIISADASFRKRETEISGVEFFADAESAFRKAEGESSGGKILTVYHSAVPEPGLYQKFSKRARMGGYSFAVLYSGNPYLLSGKTDVPVLYTFSSTAESLKQGALCAAGKFEPSVKINCALR